MSQKMAVQIAHYKALRGPKRVIHEPAKNPGQTIRKVLVKPSENWRSQTARLLDRKHPMARDPELILAGLGGPPKK